MRFDIPMLLPERRRMKRRMKRRIKRGIKRWSPGEHIHEKARGLGIGSEGRAGHVGGLVAPRAVDVLRPVGGQRRYRHFPENDGTAAAFVGNDAGSTGAAHTHQIQWTVHLQSLLDRYAAVLTLFFFLLLLPTSTATSESDAVSMQQRWRRMESPHRS